MGEDGSGTSEPGKKPIRDIGAFRKDAWAAVPEIGTSHRWYDLAYSVTENVLRSKLGKKLPRSARHGLTTICNELLRYWEHDVDVAWSLDDPMHNISIGAGEEVRTPAIWLIELFPPSQVSKLFAAIDKYAWDRQRAKYSFGQTNEVALSSARASRYERWWHLGTVQSFQSRWMFPEAQRRKLPAFFDSIELKAIQVLPSLTAVCARFYTSEYGRGFVDTAWKRRYEPELVKVNGARRSEDRKWTTWRRTQEARNLMHDSARSWLARHCPGFFAESGENQLLIELMVFEKANSEILGARNLVAHDALRALGVGTDILKRTTKLLPEFSLESVDRTLCRSFKSDGVWNFWGNSDAARRAFESRNTAPKISPDDRLAHEVDNFITDIAVELTIARYLGVMRQRYAELRDFSRERHGKFNARQIARLRKDVLTLSLDLGSVSRDVERVGSSALRDEDGAYFQIRYAFDSPRIFEPTKSLIREVRTGQLVSARELAAADREYREILGAVVSLGSSIDAMRTGRLALLVAAVSLVVAFLTFLITGPGDNAPAETLWRLLASWAFNGSG